MKLHVLSDLHLEFRHSLEISVTSADVVILAGDIHGGAKGIEWALEKFPSQLVLYVAGNHEFYRRSFPKLINELKKSAAGTNVHVIEDESVTLDGWTFVGCTLWTDFALWGNAATAAQFAARKMNDYCLVTYGSGERNLRPADTIKTHKESVAWLEDQISGPCDRTVIISHHAPSARAESPDHANSPLAPAFASNLEGLIEKSGAPLWIYGHTHFNTEFIVGTTRLLTNQFGYPQEPCAGFDPGLVVDL